MGLVYINHGAVEGVRETASGDRTFDLGSATKKAILVAIAEEVISRAEELTALDSAIGDGDHGRNMQRGLEAVLDHVDALCLMPLPELFNALADILLERIGGASGPLYATMLLASSRVMPPCPTREAICHAFSEGVAATCRRGKSTAGQKTMLDVLIPVSSALSTGSSLCQIRQVALSAADATIPMVAERGRASFLGTRSAGHMDPGARSASIIIAAFCDRMEGLHG